MAASNPRTGLDRPVMLATQPLFGRWNFKAMSAALLSVARPPARPQDWTFVLLAQPFPGRRHLPGAVAIGTPGGAVTGLPTTGSNWPAVDLAQTQFAGASLDDAYLFFLLFLRGHLFMWKT